MRIKLMGSLVAAACLIGMPMAYAQSDEEADQGADTTCADFMAMDSADQAALIEQLQSATPDLKTNGAEDSSASANASGRMSASDDAEGSSAGDAVKSDSMSADVKASAAPDSNVAEVLAACESDSNLSVGDALTR